MVSIKFPKGKKVVSFSKVTFISQENEVIRRVEIAPMRSSAPYLAVLDCVKLLADDLGITKAPSVMQQFEKAKSSRPQHDPFSRVSIGAAVSTNVDIFIEIKPSTTIDEWFATVSITIR
jgi:hypothetical protein